MKSVPFIRFVRASGVGRGRRVNQANMDAFFPLASLGNVVGRLHPNEGIYPDAEIRRAISPERSALPLSRLDRAGPETWMAVAAAVTDRLAGSVISVRMKWPG